MNIFQWEQNPWGQDILVRISWDLLWLAIIGGVLFVIGNLIYRAKNPRKAAEAPTGPAADAVPDKVVRHTLAARLFHWTMAITMFTLLITAFFPIVGIQFAWLQIHWMAGLVFVAIIIFHIIHATFWMNLRDIWISSADWAEFKKKCSTFSEAATRHRNPGNTPWITASTTTWWRWPGSARSRAAC